MEPVVIVSIVTIICGLITLIVKTCFKSKCTEVNCCCGCIKITRDTLAEEEIEIQVPKRED